ncbi:MAG: SDR family oxidoreductase [Deltaproteobacteria bacterium]|nr:SDR family oxidoreductase [Deltaproteobacteria bacterium]
MSILLIIGAKSDIARAVALEYARHGWDLILAARDAGETLAPLVADIGVRTGRRAEARELDILDFDSHEAFYEGLGEKPLGVVSAVGFLGDQERAEHDPVEARRIINTNYTGVAGLLDIVAGDLERRREGFIIGISSVAGDRGRGSNYIYGSAKAGLTAYLSGLRNRLYGAGVHVMTVKPGFVRTRMTAGMNLPSLLTSTPEAVARSIYRGQQRRRNVIYTHWIWRYIMMLVEAAPESLFKRSGRGG